MTQLAQSIIEQADMPRLLEYGIGVAAFGLIVWLVRHVTSKTIPGLVASFKESNDKQCETFERTMTRQVESFERVNKEQRIEFRETLEADRQLHHQREETLRSEFREAIRDIAAKART